MRTVALAAIAGLVVVALARDVQRPRQDSNLRTRLRRPMLYPLSYEGREPRGYR